jgi:hypothetical protein
MCKQQQMRKILTFVLSLSVTVGFSQSNTQETEVLLSEDELSTTFSHRLTIGEKERSKGDVQIYPNPMGIKTTVKVSDHETDIVNLIDITGKILRTYQPDGPIQIERAGLTTGLYFVQVVYSDGSKVTKKLVVR